MSMYALCECISACVWACVLGMCGRVYGHVCRGCVCNINFILEERHCVQIYKAMCAYMTLCVCI